MIKGKPPIKNIETISSKSKTNARSKAQIFRSFQGNPVLNFWVDKGPYRDVVPATNNGAAVVEARRLAEVGKVARGPDDCLRKNAGGGKGTVAAAAGAVVEV